MPGANCKLTPEASPGAEPPPTGQEWPPWVEPAWKLFMRGQAVWSQLGAKFGVADTTVKRQVLKYHEAARLGMELTQEDAYARYIGGLQQVLEQSWADHATASNASAKVGCLRVVLDAQEKLAAASGVVTKREGREHTGPQGGPLTVQVAVVPAARIEHGDDSDDSPVGEAGDLPGE